MKRIVALLFCWILSIAYGFNDKSIERAIMLATTAIIFTMKGD